MAEELKQVGIAPEGDWFKGAIEERTGSNPHAREKNEPAGSDIRRGKSEEDKLSREELVRRCQEQSKQLVESFIPKPHSLLLLTLHHCFTERFEGRKRLFMGYSRAKR